MPDTRGDGTIGAFPGPGRVALAGALLLALASAPLFSAVLSPLVDYPNHLARFWLLANGGNQFYVVRWALLPNLAGDLVVPLLARLMPLELAGKLFIVTTFALMIGGAAWLNRVATGAWRLWPLLAAAFLYNRQFLWGFVNYLFGLGLALCGAAMWLALERRATSLRLGAASLVSLGCFFSHIAAFGVYAIIVCGIELAPVWAAIRAGDWRGLGWRSVVTTAPFVLPAASFLVWWQPAAQGGGFSYAGFGRKADLLFSVFDNYSRPFDIVCFVLLLGLLGSLAWRGRLRIAPCLLPALVLLGIAYLVLPTQILSGSGADHRIATPLFLLLVAAAAPRWPRRGAALLSAAAVAIVLMARLAVIEAVWLSADRIYAADLAAIDALPAGSMLAVAYPARALNAGGIPEVHMPTLAVWRRAAFVPTLFAYPAQQPIALRPPYAALAAGTPPDLLWAAFVDGAAAARDQAAPILASYDFIAFVDRTPFQVRAQPCLRPFAMQPTFQIFSVTRGPGCARP